MSALICSPPEVSIVIVSYNAWTDLERCLASLAAGPPAVTHDIVVVDNASPDGSAAAVRRHWPTVRLIASPDNVGFARAVNLGIRASRGVLVLLLNSDTLVPPGAIEALVAALRADPTVAAAGPRLVDATGRLEISCGAMLSPVNELRQKTLGRLYDRGYGPVVRYVERRGRRRRYPDWVSGACLLVRRVDAEAVGLLDERYFMYGEDVDFCAALRRRGGRILFAPDAEIVHLRGRSRATVPETTARAYRESQLAFYRKHHPRWVPILRAYRWVTGKR